MAEPRKAEYLQPVDNDGAADPQHRCGADNGQRLQEARHALDDGAPRRAGQRKPAALCHQQANVVGFHDQRDTAIDQDGNTHASGRQRRRFEPDSTHRDLREHDRHDLGREDEIGLDGAFHLFLFQMQRIIRRGGGGDRVRSVMRHENVDDLLGTLETQIGAADHQKRRDRPGRESGQQQRRRQQDDQFIAQRAPGDLPDDRQFARRRKAVEVFRRDCRVVDESARRLGAGLDRLSDDIVDRGRRDLGDRRNVVEKGQKTAHMLFSISLRDGAPLTSSDWSARLKRLTTCCPAEIRETSSPGIRLKAPPGCRKEKPRRLAGFVRYDGSCAYSSSLCSAR